MKSLLHLLLCFWMAAASPALASEVLRRVPTALDPAKAYVLVEIRNLDGGPLPGTIILARYDPVGGDVRGGARSPGTALGRAADTRVAVASRALERARESRLYLVELEPDVWVIEGAAGTAFSLESRTFQIAAGQVLDLGVLSPLTDWPEGEGPPSMGRLVGMALLGPFARQPETRPAMLEIRERAAGDLAIPPAFRNVVAPATFSPGARFGNYLGGLINRIDGRRGRPGATPPVEPPPPTTAPENPS